MRIGNSPRNRQFTRPYQLASSRHSCDLDVSINAVHLSCRRISRLVFTEFTQLQSAVGVSPRTPAESPRRISMNLESKLRANEPAHANYRIKQRAFCEISD